MAIPRICSIPGCGKGGKIRRGWCTLHYERWKRHGDPEAGRTPPGEPERYMREVLLSYEGDECMIWPYTRSSGGYARVKIDGEGHQVSRILCEETQGPPPSPDHEAAHSCGKGHLGCATKGHLSWKTHRENEEDKLAHGTRNRGEKHGLSRLKQSDIIAIRAMKDTKTLREIAEEFAINPDYVGQIQRGRTWSWL